MADADFYELLGVDRGANDAAIKSAYRRLAMQYHPDKNGGCQDSAEKFKAINEAYDVLKDSQKRAAYDRYGKAAFQNGGMGNGHGAGFTPTRARKGARNKGCLATPIRSGPRVSRVRGSG